MVGMVELCRAIAAPGQAVAFATPAYPPFFAELKAAGLRVSTVGLDSDGKIDVEALDDVLSRRIARFMLSNSRNPSGHVLARDELALLAERCAAAETWVLADEIHAPLVLPGAEHGPWLEVSDAAREYGIALTSASKAFNLAALETAFIVTAGDKGREIVKRLSAQHEHASLLGTIAAEVAFAEGDAWLDAVIAQLHYNRTPACGRPRRKTPRDPLDSPRSAGLHRKRPTSPGSTARVSAWVTSRQASSSRVAALGRGLDYGQPGAGHVRLNFATSPEHLGDAVRRMARAAER